jgi:hypothetical protein
MRATDQQPLLVRVHESVVRTGRTYTLHNRGPRGDLNVDLGATVFCGALPRASDECNGMETPLMEGVIKRALGLPTGQ